MSDRYQQLTAIGPCLDIVGVTGSIPVAPTTPSSTYGTDQGLSGASFDANERGTSRASPGRPGKFLASTIAALAAAYQAGASMNQLARQPGAPSATHLSFLLRAHGVRTRSLSEAAQLREASGRGVGNWRHGRKARRHA